jgi:hypothetical protein
MTELFLILGRISWNGFKQLSFEMFPLRITLEQFLNMTCGSESAKTVFCTDWVPRTSNLPLELQVIYRKNATASCWIALIVENSILTIGLTPTAGCSRHLQSALLSPPTAQVIAVVPNT